ncbi:MULTISPECIES: phytoene desaturase family protein [unclassified Rhodococcus (in: high G+C Gram-positive bacteria)]|uniref:phytoene desaturase family protein n=1 Tax=unclassified Rhodococcus (in: high G+C Gram-positive bacteria) TaxID=192944 RepID=UPI00233E76BA|nr:MULTISPECIES: hypothetical protein [unclassified Rhodococcus (in: high G+C Gram-positive bacteria)]WSE25614.1 hypothetical protein U9J23_26330 [Rhodococcus sp. PD04]
MRDGRGVGVRDAHDEQIRVTRAVLADVPAPTLYRRLIGEEHLPARLIHDLQHFEWDDGTVKADWALSGPIPWSNPVASGAGTVHLGVDMNGLAVYHTQLRKGVLPERPFVLMGQMSTTDPSRSPPGTEAVWAYTHVPRRDLEWTAARRERFADRIQTVVELHAPGFTGSILGRVIQSPIELEQPNAALVGGAINQGTSALHQQLIFQATPGLGRADTPVDRVFPRQPVLRWQRPVRRPPHRPVGYSAAKVRNGRNGHGMGARGRWLRRRGDGHSRADGGVPTRQGNSVGTHADAWGAGIDTATPDNGVDIGRGDSRPAPCRAHIRATLALPCKESHRTPKKLPWQCKGTQ